MMATWESVHLARALSDNGTYTKNAMLKGIYLWRFEGNSHGIEKKENCTRTTDVRGSGKWVLDMDRELPRLHLSNDYRRVFSLASDASAAREISLLFRKNRDTTLYLLRSMTWIKESTLLEYSESKGSKSEHNLEYFKCTLSWLTICFLFVRIWRSTLGFFAWPLDGGMGLALRIMRKSPLSSTVVSSFAG